MKISHKLTVSCMAAVTLGLLGLAANQQYDKLPGCTEPQESSPKSQLDANNPETSEFVRILRRDVSQFLLDNNYPSANVSIALLRDSPTQVGVSLPKYYLWIEASDDSGSAVEGAMRVADIEGVQFGVTTFIRKDEIRSNPDLVKPYFPAALTPAIAARAAEK